MKKYINDAMLELKKDIKSYEKENIEIDKILEIIKKYIKKFTAEYFESKNQDLKKIIKNNLIDNYNLLYYFQAKKNGINKAFMLDDDIEMLPTIFTIDQKPIRFEIENDLLDTINIEEGLTIEQAYELLKWTVNNTRDNLNVLEKRIPNKTEDVYGNSSLGGACGFSQFSSLYPLQKMGLRVTINNVGAVNGGRHAYGTVIIPIKTEEEIVNKRILIDCTYRQFFTIPYNGIAWYISSSPEIGFFINQDNDKIEFAKEMLKNGFVEANLENLKKYLKPFFSRSIEVEDISKLEEEFSKLDIIDIIENNQEEFDYSEEELISWGCNLTLPQTKTRDL